MPPLDSTPAPGHSEPIRSRAAKHVRPLPLMGLLFRPLPLDVNRDADPAKGRGLSLVRAVTPTDMLQRKAGAPQGPPAFVRLGLLGRGPLRGFSQGRGVEESHQIIMTNERR